MKTKEPLQQFTRNPSLLLLGHLMVGKKQNITNFKRLSLTQVLLQESRTVPNHQRNIPHRHTHKVYFEETGPNGAKQVGGVAAFAQALLFTNKASVGEAGLL